jgi:hypothetical protein
MLSGTDLYVLQIHAPDPPTGIGTAPCMYTAQCTNTSYDTHIVRTRLAFLLLEDIFGEMSPSEEDFKSNIDVSQSEDKQEEDVEATSSFSSSVVSSSIKNHHKLELESRERELWVENGTRQRSDASARFLEKSARVSEEANDRIQTSTRVLDRFQSRHQLLPDREILLVSGTLRYR